MLAIHVLNVGHGDSIILEYRANAELAFAVIDSNSRIGLKPRALEKLGVLGAQSLSFVAITHPHADHYMGMRAIMEAYKGRIDNIYTFPVDRDRQRLKKLAEAYKRTIDITDSETVGTQAAEFIHILRLAKGVKVWETPAGTINRLPSPGFSDVKIYSILPPARVKGDYFQEIVTGKLQLETPKQNELSLAFLIQYRGFNIVLGGDGTYGNWIYQRKRLPAVGVTLASVAVKLPHHGSKQDCHDNVLDLLYQGSALTEKAPIGCISADGRSHPHPEVLDNLRKRGIKPYCTNLAKRCGANLHELTQAPNIDPVLVRFINSVAVDSSDKTRQACQGDITIHIDDESLLSIKTQYQHPCPLRGDYSFLGNIIN